MTDMTVAGDEDGWMLIERQSAEGLPLLVRSRVINRAITSFENDNKVSAIVLDLRPEYVTDNGFPRNLDDVHRLEDEIVEKLSALSSICFHTASVTGDARRVMYVAHSNTESLDNLVKSFEVNFGEFQLFDDFDIEVYREFVTPTALDKQRNGDQAVIAALQSNGDVGDIARKIDFWFYGDRAALDGILNGLREIGLELDHWLEDPNGLVACSNAPATSAYFRELTPQLVELADIYGVEYDGWETFIVKDDNMSEDESVQTKPKSLFKKLFGPKN